MRRRLLLGTLAITVLCIVILGVPLILLARHEVWTSAQDRLREQAASTAVEVEDRLELNRTLDLRPLLRLMPDRRIIVSRANGRVISAAGPAPSDPMTAAAAVADLTVQVQAPQGPVVARAREVTGLLAGLALLALAAAVGLAVWLSRRLAAPVARLLARADDLGRGDFTAPALVSGIPEIDELAHVLDRSARQIGSLVEVQRDFAADAAHQLRTPLTSVALHLDEMAASGDADVKAGAEQALAQVERLSGVITAFLARARGDDTPLEQIDLSALVADACAPYARLLHRDARRMHTRFTPAVRVRARSEHVLAAVTSLLDNALVHGDGTVTVSVTRLDREAQIVVSDQGTGVPADLARDIFRRRFSATRSSGIGLDLARALVATDSGTLRLDPPATFVIALPLLDGSGTEPQGEARDERNAQINSLGAAPSAGEVDRHDATKHQVEL